MECIHVPHKNYNITVHVSRLPLRVHLQEKEKRGRPKTTWRRMVETELHVSEMGLSWGEAEAIVKDNTWWKRDIVVAPCPTGGYED